MIMRTLASMARRTATLAWVGGLIAATAPARAADDALWDRTKLQFPSLREVKLPPVERVALKNGMVLYLLEDHEYPVVQGTILLRVGSKLDPADKAGLAAMMGTVLRSGGSAKYPGDTIDRRLEGIGASVEFGIGQTDGRGSFWSLKENSEEVLSIFADVLRNPAFPQEKLDLAKVAQRQAIASRNDEPFDIALREIRRLVWGKEHPYAAIPEYATVDAVTREDLVGFHKSTFYPDRAYLAVWGDFDAKAMRKKVETLFGDWKASGKPAPENPPIAAIVPGGGLAYAEKTGTTNTMVLMGHVGIRADNPDYAAMNVLAQHLGGGFSSVLFNEVRTKRGLAYMAGSSSGADIPRPGVFIAYAGTRSDSALVVMDLVQKEVRRVTQEPISEDRLKKAKDAILNSYVFEFASKGEIVSRMAYLDFQGYPADFTARYPELVRQVTAQDVLAAAKRNLHPDDLQILLVGDQKDFAKPLSSLSRLVQMIDVSIPEAPEKTEIPSATPESLARGKELLSRAVETTGGSKAWTGIKDLSQQSEVAVSIQGQNMAISIETVRTADGRDYMAQRLPFGEMIMARSPAGAWKKTPGGVEEMTKDEIDELTEDRARDLWGIFSHADRIQAQALPRESVNGRDLDVLLLSGEGLEKVFLLIDPSTGRPGGLRYRGESPMGGPVTTTELFDDFRQVGTLWFPHAMEVLHDGQSFAKGRVMRVAVNEGVKDEMFAKPGM
jgi:zinc protease